MFTLQNQNQTPDPGIPQPLKVEKTQAPKSVLSEDEKHEAKLSKYAWLVNTTDIDENRRPYLRKNRPQGSSEMAFLINMFPEVSLVGGTGVNCVVQHCIGLGEFDTTSMLGNRKTQGRIPPPLQISAEGEPIYSDRILPVWKFVKEYEPSSSWCLPGEWQQFLEAVADDLAADESRAKADAELRASQAEARRQAALARANPEGFMATAIAQGVAAAMAEMGLKPKRA